MELSMPVVWSDRCLLHEPRVEFWVGVETPGGREPQPDRAVYLASCWDHLPR